MTHPPPDTDRLRRVRALNDRMRKVPLESSCGKLVLTPAVVEFLNSEPELVPQHAMARRLYLLNALASCDAQAQANDPESEHDYGCFEVWGRSFFFKIDCYDATYTSASPDPANAEVTRRVLIIGFSEDDGCVRTA